MKMAMNVKPSGNDYKCNDHWRNCSPHLLQFGSSSSQYFPHLPGPDASLKPCVNLLFHQQSFQPVPVPQTIGPQSMVPPAVVPPDHLCFPLQCSTKPAPYLQPSQGPPALTPRPPSPTAVDEECQAGLAEQDATLEELCKPLYCKLCNVTLNSAQQAQAHYQGKNHSKKLRNFYAGSQQPPPVRIPDITEPVLQQSLTPCASEGAAPYKPPQTVAVSRVILATENDYCKLCDASFSSPAVAQAHYQGKNHAKRLRLAEAQQSSAFIESVESSQRRQRKEGNEFKLVNRRNVVPISGGPYYLQRPRQRIPRDLAMCVTPSGQFYCSMCNSGASEEADFRLHLESKQHKSKVSEQRYRNEMENLGYT